MQQPQANLYQHGGTPPTKKRKNGCVKVGVIVLAVFIGIGILVGIFSNGGEATSSSGISTEPTSETGISLSRSPFSIFPIDTISSSDDMNAYVESIVSNTGATLVSVSSTQSEDGTYDVTIVLEGHDNLTSNMIRIGMYADAEEIFSQLQNNGKIKSVGITFQMPLVDQYGNTATHEVMTILLSKETIDKINFDSFNIENFETIADYYYVHPAIKE